MVLNEYQAEKHIDQWDLSNNACYALGNHIHSLNLLVTNK